MLSFSEFYLGHSIFSQVPHLVFIHEGWICFPIPTYLINSIIIKLLFSATEWLVN